MKPIIGKEILSWIDNYLYDPRLDSEMLLRKRWTWIWMIVNLIGVTFMTVLGIIFKINPILWFGYALFLCHIIAIPIFRKSKRFYLTINITYSIIIVLAFVVMLQTGGLKSSLGFVFIGLNCAMGSVLAGNLRWTIGMFTLYCLSIILLGAFQPYLKTPDYITAKINALFFVIDAVWVNAGILFLVVLFMKDKNRFEKTKAQKLQKLDEAKTHLYTNLSHEFRTPLTIIKGITEQLEQNPKKWLQSGPQKIKTQANVLLRLVNQMLDISKIEAGSMNINLIHGDLIKYVKFVIGSFYGLTEKKGIKLNVSCEEESIYTDYDPEKLMHILANLMSNAIKFTPQHGKIVIQISKGKNKTKDFVKICVKDNGKGITNEEIEHIFDRFYQASDKDNETQGTGLGLALTKEFVEMMNGTIGVKSTISKGSEFIVTLPISKNAYLDVEHGISTIDSEAIQTIIPSEETKGEINLYSKMSSNKPVLLLVEDNEDVLEYLVGVLEDHYIIELATNGKIGFEKAQNIIPDIILTDVMMPQMDGFELVQHLKSNICTDHIPIIVLTAKGDIQSKLEGLELGADHYIVKPFSEKELLLKLDNLLKIRTYMQKNLNAMTPIVNQTKTQYRQEVLFLSKINSLLDKNLDAGDFGITEICTSLHLSRSQMYRKFTALTDTSIGRYIKRYRLHKAKNMIVKEGKNVTEAALDSGFKNLSHFSVSFNEEFGFPPSELF